MREIKFRVWDKELKEFVDTNNTAIDPTNGDVVEVGGYELLDVNHFAILEQNTGLKDKNGVEIYEGDIICQQMRFVETNGVIFWQEDKARFAVNLDGFITTITKPQEHSYEVIGNIHENAYLLEE